MTQEQVSASCVSSSLSIATQPLSTYLNTVPPEKTDTYIVKSFNPLSFFFWFIFKFTTNAVYSVVYLVHRILFSILSTTFQITVSAHSIVYVILVISIPLYACVRYYLTLYSRLPTDSKRQNPTIDTFLNSSNENETGEAQSYLDKFLSAIKIFGYLDNPVFHELTKSLQTQKIDSGEIIFIDECAGFSICVEGEIQVYSKIGKIESNNTSSINPLFAKNDNHNTVIIDGVKYQLLNIVKSGTPLSSFITVLNLLTDSQLTLSNLTPTPKFNPQRHLPKIPSDNFSLDPSNKNTFSAGNPDCAFEPDHPSSIEPNKESHSPELIAIPKNNCTISMIPKESFTRIASKFPKDTSHIIQMVLTKLHRVTFHTAHNFLDLTPNIFQTEINLNQLQNSYDKKLPKYLQNLAIDYIENENQLSADSSTVTSKSTNRNVRQKKNLKSKNLKVNSSKNLIDINGPLNDLTSRLSSSAFSPSPSVPSSPSSSSVSSAAAHFLKKEESDAEPKSSKNRRKEKIARISKPANQNCMDFLTSDGDDSILLTESTNNNFDIGMKNRRAESNSFKNKAPPTASIKGKSRHFVFNNKSSTNPGDLLSNVPLPRSSEVNLKSKLSELDVNELKDRTFSGDDEETEESTLRTALAEKISNLIGLDKQNFPANFSNGNSNGGINSLVSSPRMGASNISSGIRYVTPVSDSNSNLRSKYNKIRTFSTTSIDGINNGLAPEDSCSVNSDIYKSFVNYNNVKREFASDIKFFKIPKDTKIIKSKEQTPGIYYVIDGSFDVTYLKKESDFVGTYINEPEQNNINKHATKTNSTNHNNGSNDDTDEKIIEEYLYTIREGEIAGYLGTLIGSKSFFDVTANTDSYVAFLSREFFEFLLERYPNLHLSIAHLLLKVLDKKLYLTDYALEWIHLSAAEILYKQLDPANGIYIVLNGRLRSLSKNKSEYVILGEYGQGESMGEMEVLTKSKRLTTVISIRDSELARIPRTLFEIIALSNPSIMVQISRIVADRVKIGGLLMESESYIAGTASTRIKDEPMVQNFNNYRTLSLLPVSDGTIPLVEFAEQLATALEKVGKTVKILNQSAALSNLGKYAFDKLAKLKQGGYFSELEEKYDIVIYLCDAAVNSTWTKTCIQQGDCIILLADATLSPDVGEYERLLVKSKTTARTELVLLHPGRYIEPGSTHKWLKNRIWVHAHHHIQMQCHNDYQHVDHRTTMFGDIDNLSLLSTKLTDKFFFRMENIVNNNEFLQFLKQTKEDFRSKKHYRPLQEHKDDFMRLARLLTGQALGLVLGGGGARGISHVGIIKALEDNGIPVDIIGGTSIGAFVGGLYAKDYDFVPVYGRAKTFAGRMGSVWRSLLDLTIPLTSYLTGHEFNRGIWKAFGDSRIEDFWIKYYANSTNITDSVMEIHTSGYAWRYIRASMTLASLLPPLTDDGNMLMDGGYIDNLTVTEMQRRGAKHIIAVDVGSVDDRSPMNYGDTLNGWWVLINRLNPLSGHANVPTMADIQMRLAYVASVNALERAKNSKGCSYLRPPIEAYATLAFGKFDEIYNVGLQYGTQELRELMKKWDLKIEKKQFFPSKKSRRRYSM